MYSCVCVCLLLCFSVNVLDNVVSASVLPNKHLYRLDIVHYNDFHDRFVTSEANPRDTARKNGAIISDLDILDHIGPAADVFPEKRKDNKLFMTEQTNDWTGLGGPVLTVALIHNVLSSRARSNVSETCDSIDVVEKMEEENCDASQEQDTFANVTTTNLNSSGNSTPISTSSCSLQIEIDESSNDQEQDTFANVTTTNLNFSGNSTPISTSSCSLQIEIDESSNDQEQDTFANVTTTNLNFSGNSTPISTSSCSLQIEIDESSNDQEQDTFANVTTTNLNFSGFEETSVSYPICKTNNSECLGGFPRLYQEVMTLMREKPGALLLNAGDTFQGTYWYTLLKWNVTQKFINMLPNDAHAIGNHEFDDGIAGLAPYLAALKAPVVAANMDTTAEPALNGLYKPHVIVERKGRRIGIIGLITPDTMSSSNPQGVIFLDPIEVVKKEAQILTDDGVDIIIVLSHCGLEVDIEMAEKVGEHLDIIVGGHSHSLLWNGTAPSNETVSGPYPVIVRTDSRPGHKVLVVTASAMSKYLGNLTAYFNEEGELQSFDGSPVFLNRSIPEDPEIKALLQPYKDKLYSLVNEVVGYSTDDMLGKDCGAGECFLGDIIADSILNATLEKYDTNLTSVSFLLRNMIRGSLPKGEISRGSIINTLPFGNKIVTFVLQGRYLVEAFQACLKQNWVPKPFNGPHMPQIAGIKLTLNTTNTNDSVVSAAIKDGDDYKALDLDQDYQVTCPVFLLKDGTDFQVLKEKSRDVRTVGKDADIFEEYIKKRTPIVPVLDNRLTVIN